MRRRPAARLTAARLTTARLRSLLPLAVPFDEICFRSVRPKYANEHGVLSPAGSLMGGGRYNRVDTFGALYLSCDPHTCLEECIRTMENTSYQIADLLPRTTVGIAVRLDRVLNLTDDGILNRLNITQADLLRPGWRAVQRSGREAFTQRLGRLAREAGFQALLVPSAAQRGGKNLIVFTDNVPDGALRPINLPLK